MKRKHFDQLVNIDLPSTSKRRRIEASQDVVLQGWIQSLPPELLEEILSWVSVRDVTAFGATCHAFHQLCLSTSLWKRLCRPYLSNTQLCNWRRTAILNYTRALHLHRLDSNKQGCNRTQLARSGGQQVTQAAVPPLALGFKRILPTRDNVLLWDHQGTLFLLQNSPMTSELAQMSWRNASHHSVLRHNVKDFATDPRNNLSFRQYVYVLACHFQDDEEGSSGESRCDCVEVYQQDTGIMVSRITFHSMLTFTQLQLTGSEVNRKVLLLTDLGKVYTLTINERQLYVPIPYATYLEPREITGSMPDLSIKKIHTSSNGVLYLTDEGSVYREVHTQAGYRRLYGSQAEFNPYKLQEPLPLPLPYKVVKCSMGPSHLCLLDDCGRVFMQGRNHYGQLGTGDKIDRDQLTQVVQSQTPVDVWCGLNHSLALLEGETGIREVQGCGCGGGGRLPGWPKGSAVFVKLNIKVPQSAHSLCSSKHYLYLLCCHDVEEAPLFPGSGTITEKTEEERLQA